MPSIHRSNLQDNLGQEVLGMSVFRAKMRRDDIVGLALDNRREAYMRKGSPTTPTDHGSTYFYVYFKPMEVTEYQQSIKHPLSSGILAYGCLDIFIWPMSRALRVSPCPHLHLPISIEI